MASGVSYPCPPLGDHNHHAIAVGFRDPSLFHETARSVQQQVAEADAAGMRGRGVFVCISPWNFPLAIFLGQVAA